MTNQQKPTEDEVKAGIRTWRPDVVDEFWKWVADGEGFDAPVGYDLQSFVALVRQVQQEPKAK
ncbi:MAG: hypothetical protein ACYCVL_04800 [Gemmatimonadaceae bacterium]